MNAMNAYDLDTIIVTSGCAEAMCVDESEIKSDNELLITMSDGTKYRITIQKIEGTCEEARNGRHE